MHILLDCTYVSQSEQLYLEVEDSREALLGPVQYLCCSPRELFIDGIIRIEKGFLRTHPCICQTISILT